MGLFLPLLLTLLHTEALAGTSVWVRVGDGVTLPCNGSRALGIPENELHVIWRTPTRNVWSFKGGTELAGPGYEHRAEVSRDGIGQGNFSLTLRRTRISDSDLYECSYFTGSLQFLGDVELSVTYRKASLNLKTGGSLSVPLFTGEPVEVLFDRAGAGNSTSVCSVQSSTASCVPQYRDRVSVDNQELRLQELRASDQGSYTVRDLQGNTISTVIVTVEARRDNVTLQAGASLSVPLLTGEPVEVLFDPAGSTRSLRVFLSSAGLPGPGYEQRVWVQDGSLTLRSLTPADQGSYTVRDLQGNTISTVIVTVEETPHRAAHLIPAIVLPSALVIVIAVAVVMWRKHRK